MSSLATRGVRGALAAFASQGTSLVARFATIIVLARLLVPEYFGLVAIVSAFAELAASVIQFGLPLAAAQAESLSARAKSTLFVINTLAGLVFAAGFLSCANLVASIYGDSQLVEITSWLALVPFAVGLSAQFRAQMMSDLRFVSIEAVVTASHLISMASAITVAALTGSIYALVVLVVMPQAIQLPCFLIFSRWRPTWPGAWVEARSIVVIGSHIFVINLLKNISRIAVIPVLGIFETPKDVGFYDRAYQLSAVPANTVMDSLQRIVVPLLSRVRTDRDRLHKSYEKIQTATTLTLVTGSWVVAAVGQPLVVLALGDEWSFTGAILQLLAIGTGFRLMAMMEQWLFIGGAATGAGVVFSAWSQPLVIIISLAGLPWGVLGVAAANALAWALFWPLSTIAAAKATGLNGRSLLKKAFLTSVGFSGPVALSAVVPRLFLDDPVAVVAAGTAAAFVLGSLLVLVLPSNRATVVNVVAAALDRRSRTKG
ncbi:oligosaccharide flippase family protein [Mycolicibacterium vaccae]|uniref:oligosaccharide flippase family protein n=1 Tax=Mycolicibacterium vaccae TaxID=1810 RepID=UPI003CF034FE